MCDECACVSGYATPVACKTDVKCVMSLDNKKDAKDSFDRLTLTHILKAIIGQPLWWLWQHRLLLGALSSACEGQPYFQVALLCLTLRSHVSYVLFARTWYCIHSPFVVMKNVEVHVWLCHCIFSLFVETSTDDLRDVRHRVQLFLLWFLVCWLRS